MSWVSDSYYARFGNFPPVLYWRGTVKGFQALMMQALERGTPLTADELMEVQGHKPIAGGEPRAAWLKLLGVVPEGFGEQSSGRFCHPEASHRIGALLETHPTA